MLRILHISDLHFGPPYVPQVGEALLGQAAELDLDAIVVSGDFTQRAKEEQFVEARRFLDRLPQVPKLVIPGNHDVPLWRLAERLLEPRRLYREYISEQLDPVLHRRRWAWIRPRPGARSATAGSKQLARPGAGEDAVRIVVAHHHFAPAPDYASDQTMPRARRAIDRFVQLEVEMILGGHLHRSYIGNTLDLYPGNERDRGHRPVRHLDAGDGPGSGSSFNLILLDDAMIRVMHFMFFDDEERFSPLSRHTFPRPGRSFVDE